MARKNKGSVVEGIVGGGMITAWGLLFAWLFCPPVFVFLVVLLFIGAGLGIYVFFKK